MSWLGKFLGGAFGFFMGGPLGAILGASLGHQFDVGMEGVERYQGKPFHPGDQHRVQMAFFTVTFSVMGHIAKADGQVSKSEIDLAGRVMDEMQLTHDMRKTAINLFEQGKSVDFPLDAALNQFRKECHRRKNLLRMFLEIQIQEALADGALDATEERLLLHICGRIGISRFEYQSIKIQLQAQQRFYQDSGATRPQRPNINDAYAILGVSPSASTAEIKKAYRRLISQHHPDKLVAKGLPEEMMTIAKEKTQKIRKAYETVMANRKN